MKLKLSIGLLLAILLAVSVGVAGTRSAGPNTVTVDCAPGSFTFTGSPIEPCTAYYTDASSTEIPISVVSYSLDTTNVGTVTASAEYDDGGTLYTGSTTFQITQATSIVNVICVSPQTFTGVAIEACTADYSTSDGLTGSLTVAYTDNIYAGTASASATYDGDANHASFTGTGTFHIDPADADCTSIGGWTGTYDGLEHPISGSCWFGGVDLKAFITQDPPYKNAPGGSIHWSFDGHGSLRNQSGNVAIVIGKANPVCTLNTTYEGPYTGTAHGNTGSCVGILGEAPIGTLDLGTTYTNVDFGQPHWVFTGNSNYNDDSGYGSILITAADAICNISDYSVVYNGNPHGALGTCTGVNGESPAPNLNLTTVTDVPGGSADWSLTSSNYKSQTGSVNITITPALSTVTVTCPADAAYTGSAIEPCTAEATGVGMTAVNVSASLVYTSNTDPGVATAEASWGGDGSNHDGSSGSATFVIKKTATVSAVANGKTYGAGDPALSVTPSGFLPADEAALTFGATRATGEDVGIYAITPWASGAPLAYYTVSYIPTDFTITRASTNTTVSCAPGNFVYTGSDITPCSATTTGAGGLNLVTPLTLDSEYSGSGLPRNASSTPYTATYTYAQTANYLASGPASATFLITRAPTTTVLTCPGAPYTYTGSNIRLCVATTTRNSDGVVVATNDRDRGSNYTPSSSQTNVGTYTANSYTYDQTTNYLTSTASAITFQIVKAPSTMTLICPTSAGFTGSPVTPCTARYYGAGISSSGVSNPVTYSNNTAIGTATASSTWGGDTNHTGSSATTTFQILPATTTTVTCPAAPLVYNGTAQEPCTAVVTGPGGVVITTPAPVPSYNNNTNAGTANVTFNFPGDGTYAASSGTGTFTISRAATTTVITCETRTYTGSTIRPCTATTTRNSDGFVVQTDPLTSSGEYNPGSPQNVGTYQARSYTYSQTTNYSQSIAPAVNFDIIKAPSSVTVTCPPSAGYTGSPVTPCTARYFGINISSSGVLFTPVDYLDNINPGTATASATWGGDANHEGSTSLPVTFQIMDASFTSVTCPVSVPWNGTAQTPCTAVVTNTAGVAITTPLPVATYSNNTNVGTATARFDFPGDATYAASSDSKTFTIERAPTITIVTCPATVVYTGSTIRPCSRTTTGPGGLNQSSNMTSSSQYSPTGSPTNGGTYTATYTFSQTSTYASSTDSKTFQIIQAPSTVTVSCPVSVPYSGSAQTPCTATVPGVPNPDIIWTYTNNTDAGSTATVTAEFAGNTNYGPGSGSGSFLITAAALICDVTGYNVTYDGAAHTASGSCRWSAGGGPFAIDLSATTQINAGTYNNVPWSFHDDTYGDANGTVSSSIAKRDATCEDGRFWFIIYIFYFGPYDGQQHPNVVCTGAGGVDLSSQVTYSPGPMINVGSGTVDWTFHGGTNYNDQGRGGYVNIYQATATCTITNPSVHVYDGQPHGIIGTCTGAGGTTLTGLDLGATFIPVGTYTTSWALNNPNYNNPGGNHNVTVRITPAPSLVTVTCPASIPYTGLPLEPCTAVVSGAGVISSQTVTWTYTNNLNAGPATVRADYAGDANHTASFGSATFTISKATSEVTVICPESVTYTGEAQTPCSASYLTSDGLSGSLTPTYENNINAGTATASATYPGDSNHEEGTKSATFTIGKADSTVTVTCPTTPLPYTGLAQEPCSAVATGIGGLDLAITISYSNNTNVGTATASATFEGDDNHKPSTGSATFTISKVDATCTVQGYDVWYDGNPHTATGTCLGVLGESLSGLELGGTTHTDGGDYLVDGWVFTDITGNYNNASGTVHDHIAKVDATCTVNGYDEVYDGAPHGASGACIGVKGETLTGLDLGQKFTDVPGGTAHWRFTGGSNYVNQEGRDVAIIITQATSTTTVTCPASVPYTGSALKPCTAKATGAGGLDQSLTVYYKDNINLGKATADATFTGDINHTSSTGFKFFMIVVPPTPTVTPTPTKTPTPTATPTKTPVPLTGGGETLLATSDAPQIPGNPKEDSVTGSDKKAQGVVLETQVPPALQTATAAAAATQVAAGDQATQTAAAGVASEPGAGSKPEESSTGGRWAAFLSKYSGLLKTLAIGFLGLLIFFMTRRRKKEEPEKGNPQ